MSFDRNYLPSLIVTMLKSFDDEIKLALVSDLENEGILFVEDGNHGEYRPLPHEFVESGVPFVRPPNLIDGRINLNDCEKINEEAFKRVRKGIGRGGDIVLTHNATIGRLAITKQTDPIFVTNPQTTVWRTLNHEVLDPRYLYYFMRSAGFQEQLSAHKGRNATFDYVSLTKQRSLCIPLINILQQKEIAELLTAIDDRIALLRETNTTLESIAQALFKSWFVDFDPVHANAGTQAPSLPPEIQSLFPSTFVESPLGVVPEGWSAGILGDVAETARKQIRPEVMTVDNLYVGLEHIPRQSLGLDRWGTAEELESAKSCFDKGDILFGKLRPYFHKIVIAPFAGICSTDILVCKAKVANFYGFVAMHLFSTELVSYANRLSNGAKMPRVNWKDLADYQLVIPPSDLALVYSDTVQSMFDQIVDNVLLAQSLANLRDTLLPRLISGQLRLPEVEKILQ